MAGSLARLVVNSWVFRGAQDLDIDSIDAVDLVVELKKMTGKKIKPEDFKSVRTVQDVVTEVEKLLD